MIYAFSTKSEQAIGDILRFCAGFCALNFQQLPNFFLTTFREEANMKRHLNLAVRCLLLAMAFLALSVVVTSASNKRGVSRSVSKAASPYQVPTDTLEGCLGRCESQYAECQNDLSVTNKTVCHNNRTTCTTTCYNTYGAKQPKTFPKPE